MEELRRIEKGGKKMRNPKADLEICNKLAPEPLEVDNGMWNMGRPTIVTNNKKKVLTIVCSDEEIKQAWAIAQLVVLASEALPFWITRARELESERDAALEREKRLREALKAVLKEAQSGQSAIDSLITIVEIVEKPLKGGEK